VDLQLASVFFLVLLNHHLLPLQETQHQLIITTTKCGSPACQCFFLIQFKDLLLFRMYHQSPARILRNVKRITNFPERKTAFSCCTVLEAKPRPSLSIQHLPDIDIPPLSSKLLSSQTLPSILIVPKSQVLSFRKFPTTEIVPGSRWEDDILFSSYINGGSHTTTFVCHICYDDFSYKSADSIRDHILSSHGQEIYHRFKNNLNSQPKYEELNW
jgi:hypothetical protein